MTAPKPRGRLARLILGERREVLIYRRENTRGNWLQHTRFLNSREWADIKQKYYASDRPQECLACGNKWFDLHHIRKDRMREGHLCDLVPLCRQHHKEQHEGVGIDLTEYYRAAGVKVTVTGREAS